MTTRRKQSLFTLLLVLLILSVAIGFPAIQNKLAVQTTCLPSRTQAPTPSLIPERLEFNGERALEDIATQLSFGPRYPGSDGHQAVIIWITQELETNGWNVTQQTLEIEGHTVHNLIAHHGESEADVLFGAHYDTRLWADEDPDPTQHGQPVPGANDGASGVAVLLELSRVIPPEAQNGTWLIFFDAEDQGRIPGWDWILGSTAFVETLTFSPQAVVVVDMIGDSDLNIHREKNSNAVLTDQIWSQAAELGYEDIFIDKEKYSILDDHTPFLKAGIPAVDLIDFDYPSWHTIQDDIEHVSANSLQAVGDTLLAWITQRKMQ